jgi:hypothetical protein
MTCHPVCCTRSRLPRSMPRNFRRVRPRTTIATSTHTATTRLKILSGIHFLKPKSLDLKTVVRTTGQNIPDPHKECRPRLQHATECAATNIFGFDAYGLGQWHLRNKQVRTSLSTVWCAWHAKVREMRRRKERA